MREFIKKLLAGGPVKEILPRLMFKPGKPLYLAVGVHTEHVHVEAVYKKMAEFGKQLPFKGAAFIMTPRSPIVAKEMAEAGVSEETFTERLKLLSGMFEVGMHGHCCRLRRQGSIQDEPAQWLVRAGFERTSGFPREMREQFKAEYDYLSADIGRPEIYSGGWWFMNATVASLLEEYGVYSDCTIRHDASDSFGNRYLTEEELPVKGLPFVLPPSRNVVEFPSVAYLYSDWWRIVLALLPMLVNSDGPLFAVLPMHDHDLPEYGDRILENIRLLSKIRNVRFVPFSGMRHIAQEAG